MLTFWYKVAADFSAAYPQYKKPIPHPKGAAIGLRSGEWPPVV